MENWQRANISKHMPQPCPRMDIRIRRIVISTRRCGLSVKVTVELTINGASHRLGSGGLGFVHSNEEHGIKNVGKGPATYFVVAIGPGADT